MLKENYRMREGAKGEELSDGVLIVGTGGEWDWEQKIAASYNPADQTVGTERTDQADSRYRENWRLRPGDHQSFVQRSPHCICITL